MSPRVNDILSNLNPNFEIKNWYNSNVIDFREVPFKKFYTPTSEKLVRISPNLITGTSHDSYNKGTWIEMLGGLKERGCLWTTVTKELVLKIINQQNLKNDFICIHQFSNDYIIISGNHRSCYAKFLELEYIEVMLTKYILNEPDFNIF